MRMGEGGKGRTLGELLKSANYVIEGWVKGGRREFQNIINLYLQRARGVRQRTHFIILEK